VLQDLWLVGEVSNYTQAASGHVYLTLKDPECQLRCVMWRSIAARQAYLPSSGDEVLAHGHISVYEAGGAYQFYIDAIQPRGIGELYLQFEALKERLAHEGLFDEARKRPLPPFPRCIGVASSPTGAAFRDILNVLSRRYPLVSVILAPTLVQGTEAPTQLVDALLALQKRPEIDLIIVTRGGGSLEDLWAFNDEGLARAIADCAVPVISGVGHETDYTISDLVADMRAPTPSAAAEIAVPDCWELANQLENYETRLSQRIYDICVQKRTALTHMNERLARHSPQGQIDQYRQRLDDRARQLTRLLTYDLRLKREKVASYQRQLDSLNPLKALERGYAIVRRGIGGEIVHSRNQVKAGDLVQIQVTDGTFDACVEDGDSEGNDD
jgi:exodeoxyribonuclease VII large subunit